MTVLCNDVKTTSKLQKEIHQRL